MRLRAFALVLPLFLSFFCYQSANATDGSDGSGSSTCSSPDGVDQACPDPTPYTPTPCETAMNEIWNASQTQIEQLLATPLCADFGDGRDIAVTELGASDNTLRGGNGKYVVVKKRALRKLRRQARKRAC